LVPISTRDFDLLAWDTTRYTDWQKLLIGGVAHYTNAQAFFSGGNVNTQFIIGGSYSKQATPFPGDYSDKKISGYFNINHLSSNQKLKALFSASYVDENNVLPPVDFTSLIKLPPDAPALYDGVGNLNWQNNTWANPFANLYKRARAITDNLFGN